MNVFQSILVLFYRTVLVLKMVELATGSPSMSYTRLNNSALGHTYFGLVTDSAIECCEHCLQDTKCRAVNFDKSFSTCELNDKHPLDYPYRILHEDPDRSVYYANIDPCDAEWNMFDRSCYYFVSERMQWNESKANCESLSSKLVEIDNQDENQFLNDTLGTFGIVEAWIGLNDKAVEGSFVWPSGMPLKYINFQPDEPNARGDEHCVQYIASGNWSAAWNDIACECSYASVCEKIHY